MDVSAAPNHACILNSECVREMHWYALDSALWHPCRAGSRSRLSAASECPSAFLSALHGHHGDGVGSRLSVAISGSGRGSPRRGGSPVRSSGKHGAPPGSPRSRPASTGSGGGGGGVWRRLRQRQRDPGGWGPRRRWVAAAMAAAAGAWLLLAGVWMGRRMQQKVGLRLVPLIARACAVPLQLRWQQRMLSWLGPRVQPSAQISKALLLQRWLRQQHKPPQRCTAVLLSAVRAGRLGVLCPQSYDRKSYAVYDRMRRRFMVALKAL